MTRDRSETGGALPLSSLSLCVQPGTKKQQSETTHLSQVHLYGPFLEKCVLDIQKKV